MWICKMCETGNADHLTRCSACGAAKPTVASSVFGSHNTGTSRTTTTTPAAATSAGSASSAAPAATSKGGSSLGVWLAILLIAAAIYYFTGGGDQMAMYRDVMLGNKPFISGDTGATATINETYKCFMYDARHGSPEIFLLADVDHDSKDEVVIGLSEDDYRLVLDAQGSTVYGYLFSIREMTNIYSDGSFDWSSSAYESGYAYASFNGRSRSTRKTSGSNKSREPFTYFSSSHINSMVK